MIAFTVQTEITRPPSEVFAFVTDPAKLATWQTNTISAAAAEEDRPFGVGTRIREVHRAPGGRQLVSLVEVSEPESERVFALRMLEGPLPIHARITLEPTERGTCVRFEAHGHLSGLMRVAQPLIRFTLRREFAGYCATLKRVLESHAPTV
jgi:uncharacterized protein YndB with AHSA1/START domain